MPKKAILGSELDVFKLIPLQRFDGIMTFLDYSENCVVMRNIHLVHAMPMQVGECPLWDALENTLYWIDIGGMTVHRLHTITNVHHFWTMPCEPGCIALCADGGLIVALRSGIALLDTNSGTLTSILSAPYDTTTTRFNDGRCDSRGRLWVGTLYEPRNHAYGELYCVERGLIRRADVEPVTVSNGVAFSGTDGGTLFHADTTAHRIRAYDFDCMTSNLQTGRIFKEFSSDRANNYGGRPDGAAVDSEDCYWIAMYEGGCIKRLSSRGEELESIDLPVRCPTMMAFGGGDLRTLYITSAAKGRPAEEMSRFPWTGCLLSVRITVAGRPETRYVR